jgi:hypothetical protein
MSFNSEQTTNIWQNNESNFEEQKNEVPNIQITKNNNK